MTRMIAVGILALCALLATPAQTFAQEPVSFHSPEPITQDSVKY
jgi:hypothetical protein